jgi:hypothetical protein
MEACHEASQTHVHHGDPDDRPDPHRDGQDRSHGVPAPRPRAETLPGGFRLNVPAMGHLAAFGQPLHQEQGQQYRSTTLSAVKEVSSE